MTKESGLPPTEYPRSADWALVEAKIGSEIAGYLRMLSPRLLITDVFDDTTQFCFYGQVDRDAMALLLSQNGPEALKGSKPLSHAARLFLREVQEAFVVIRQAEVVGITEFFVHNRPGDIPTVDWQQVPLHINIFVDTHIRPQLEKVMGLHAVDRWLQVPREKWNGKSAIELLQDDREEEVFSVIDYLISDF